MNDELEQIYFDIDNKRTLKTEATVLLGYYKERLGNIQNPEGSPTERLVQEKKEVITDLIKEISKLSTQIANFEDFGEMPKKTRN